MNGMDVDEDGDCFFDDDDFQNIPDEELQWLEQSAIILTQQDPSHIVPTNKIFPKPQSISSVRRANSPSITGPSNVNNSNKYQDPRKRSSVPEDLNSIDGLILDENGLSLTVGDLPQSRPQRRLDETTQREEWRVNRFAQPNYSGDLRQFGNPAQNQRLSIDPVHKNVDSGLVRLTHAQQDSRNASAFETVKEDALRSRITELLREKDELTARLQESKEEVVSRRGEIANLRARQSNDAKALQRQMALLEKAKQEESEKHAASIQAMNVENSRIASEVQFLKQDLKEELRKVEGYQRQLKERPLADKSSNVNTTPNRNRTLRDGFDDVEMRVSPVKSGRKSKQTTPTANRKRKQPTTTQIQVQPLALRLSNVATEEIAKPNEPPKADKNVTIVRKDYKALRHLKLIQKVLNFRPRGSLETSVERLFKLSLPNEPGKSLGTIVTNAIAKLQGARLPGDLIQIFIELWSGALKERYHTCIALLVEVISFIVEEQPLAVDKLMLSSILPILEATITINATARFKMQKDYINNGQLPKPAIDPTINNTACLELLYTFACLSYDDRNLIELFWRSLSTDFVLMMLNGCQTIPDLPLMLKILATSILPNTFSNITEATEQARYEIYTIDRVCYLLSQLARPDADKPPYPQKQLCYLRQESLNLLTQLTLGSSSNPFDPSSADNYGTKLIANHRNAISRLTRCIYDELALAYLMTPTQHLHINLVNTAIRVLHFVLFSPAGLEISWQTKISAQTGGAHKFRVVMARLACAEGNDPGIDMGITEDTIRMATELLEEVTIPDELEDIVRVFESDSYGGSRKQSSISSTQR